MFYSLYKANGTGFWYYNKFPKDLANPLVGSPSYNDHIFLSGSLMDDNGAVVSTSLFGVMVSEWGKNPPF